MYQCFYCEGSSLILSWTGAFPDLHFLFLFLLRCTTSVFPSKFCFLHISPLHGFRAEWEVLWVQLLLLGFRTNKLLLCIFAVFIYDCIYFHSLRKSLILKRGTTSSNSFTSLWKTEVTLNFLPFFNFQSTCLMARRSKGTQILPEVFWFCFAFTKPFLCSQLLLNKALVDFWL